MKLLAVTLSVLLPAALALPSHAQSPQQMKAAEANITPAGLIEPIRELSSDAYTGRHPGTTGETRSVAYIIAQCKAMGLKPAGANGSWTQPVPLWGMLSEGSTLRLSAGGHDVAITPGKDYAAFTQQPQALVDLASTAVVFAGYGVTAPEYHWDDYAGTDVHGKTVILLTGDPPVADPANPAALDPNMFQGAALSVYGRGGTKFENAWKHGAAAVILLSATAEPAPSLFENYLREIETLRGPEERHRVQALAVLGLAPAAGFFAAAGANLEALKASAAKPGFHAVALAGQASFHIISKLRQFESANILAAIPGSDPRLRNEYVFYSAHWDHHGQTGDRIFHGASDNAAGTSGILAIARAFLTLDPAPRRTIVFLWPTAEEKGLLGARYYVEHPLYPLPQTVADINLDYFSNWGWGHTRDFSIVGLGNSTLDDLADQVVKSQGRVVTGDTAPEQGFYFRSDHYEFARGGVPSIETSPGIDYLGKPASFGLHLRADYIAHDYHQPSDEIKPGWDLSGAVEDLDVLFEVGLRVAQSDARPTWKAEAVWRPRAGQ